MWPTIKNMQSELHQIQHRMQLLKEQNKKLLKNSKFSESKEIINLDKINGDVIISGLNLYPNTDEAKAVENCNRKFMELVENRCRKKIRKKLLKNMYKNRMPIYHQQKKNIIDKNRKSIDKNRNHNKAETITLSDDDYPETSSQKLTSVVDKRTVTKLDSYQRIQKNNCLQNYKDGDVVYLEITNPKKTAKAKKLKKTLNNGNKCKNSEINFTNSTRGERTTKNFKDIYHDSGKKVNKLSNKRFSSVVEKNGSIIKNELENNNQDVIYLETVSQPLVKNISEYSSYEKIHEELEVSGSKSNLTMNKVPDSSEQELSEPVVPVWDFTEEPIDFDIPYLHINEIIYQFSQRKIELLRSKGITIKIGRWSEKEVALLHRNYKNFTIEFGVNDACLLLGIGRTYIQKGEYKNVMKFWKAKHFLVRLGKDLNSRPLSCIYQKARREFFPIVKGKTGKVKDIPFLLELQHKYGNNWTKIGQKLNLQPINCRVLFLQHSKSVNLGKWTKEEREHLINAIKKITKVTDISNHFLKRIPWDRVAELIPTRNSTQCSTEWYHNQDVIRKIL